MHPRPDAASGRELHIHAECLTPLRGTLSDGADPVLFAGWLQLLAWLENRLSVSTSTETTSSD